MCPGTEDYIDLARTMPVVRAKVTTADGGNLGNDAQVGVVNNLLHSLFKQVDVFLKEKQVTQAAGMYAYRAYIETLLNYGPAAKNSQLTSALFYKDTAGRMNSHNPTLADNNANVNLGLKARYRFNAESKTIEMVGPIFSDIFFSERLLLSYVDLKVVLNRNSKEFCIMAAADDTSKLVITDVYLKIRKVKVNPDITIAHELALKKGPAIYPIRRVDCKSFIIPGGNPSLHKDNIFNGLVPKSLIVGMVASAAFTIGLAAAVNLVCYAEFENTIQIDADRNIIYDYTG
ncbi:uncharacterized protein F54H12.2-like [Dendronephthya gigantea]|uniref:uncharacterized protein F54H12.2-like n=1 Tax=Dendronephthya gigantea TaxID=151771 RepID=UPI00106C5FF2|nr:uncharacterized protein F54H12.2-like [Dendronephthya gigantea]